MHAVSVVHWRQQFRCSTTRATEVVPTGERHGLLFAIDANDPSDQFDVPARPLIEHIHV
jgi:hypothetical protein